MIYIYIIHNVILIIMISISISYSAHHFFLSQYMRKLASSENRLRPIPMDYRYLWVSPISRHAHFYMNISLEFIGYNGM